MIKKVRFGKKKEIKLCGLPIISYGEVEVNGVTEKYYELFPKTGNIDVKDLPQVGEDKDECSDSIKLYSFDIFDTLITRKIAQPIGIFWEIEKELKNNEKYNGINPFLISNFKYIRQNTEIYIRESNRVLYDIYDVTFDDIYNEIAKNYSLSKEQKEILMQLEINTELENFVPIKSNIEIIKELVSNKKRVILVSDMYHSSATIRKFLLRFDDIFSDIPIFVSSEENLTKSSKKLFEKLKENFNLKYSEWEHYGDNKRSDYEIPLSLGIKANKFNYPELQEHEKKLLDNNLGNIDLQSVIGASKLTRLFKNQNEKEDFGSNFIAPILVPYCNFILDYSKRHNINTLYFIARDGYILKAITDHIINMKNMEIKTKYIYGSRLAWQLPCFASGKIDIKDLLYVYKFDTKILFEMLNLSKSEIKRFFPEKIINSKNISCSELEELCINFRYNKKFIKHLHDKYQKAYNILKKYLLQEIDFSENDFAFVDLRGSGNTQNMLAIAFSDIMPQDVTTFFYELSTTKTPEKNICRIVYNYSNEVNIVLEKIARAPHAQTIGYEEKNNKIYPVLENSSENIMVKSYLKGVKNFMDQYFELNGNIDIATECSLKYLRYLSGNIDENARKIIENIKFKDFGKEQNAKQKTI